jgi:hypothetical protein
MKIEANPTPEQLKWLALIILVAAGIGHDELLIMVGL